MTRTKMDEKTRKLTAQISLGLMAGMTGMFAYAPVGFAMPEQMAGATFDATYEDATVKPVDGMKLDKAKNIMGTGQNNVLNWIDFSVASNEQVQFDGGTKTKDYLNIVNGAATSQIDGSVIGGKNVYLINPNGVIFGEGSSVNVGSLYVSTRPLEDLDTTAFQAGGSPLKTIDTNTYAPSDIVNMGKIAADNVEIEGHNIRFVTTDVTKSNGKSAFTGKDDGVKLTALNAYNSDGSTELGYIHLGIDMGSTVNEENGVKIHVDGTSTYSAGATTPTGYSKGSNSVPDIENYMMVYGVQDLANVKDNLSGNYMLAGDIGKSVTVTPFAPIGNGTKRFTGSLDGNFHKLINFSISNINAINCTDAGLFAYLSGNATVKNLGLTDVKVTGTNTNKSFTGAIAGRADGKSQINNVFVTTGSNSISGNPNNTGGLVGSTLGVTISSSYFSGDVDGGGLIGSIYNSSGISISNSYAMVGSNRSRGLVSSLNNATFSNISNSYTDATAFGNGNNVIHATGSSGKRTSYYSANKSTVTLDEDYSASVTAKDTANNTASSYLQNGNLVNSPYAAWSISNTGGLQYANGHYYRPTWRIYEGQSLPLLTAFFKGTVQADYTVTMGTGTVNTQSNVANLGNSTTKTITPTGGTTAFTLEGNGNVSAIYNGQTPTLSGVTFYGANNDSSLIKNNSFDVLNSKNVGTYYLFSSAQDGYDIAGDKIEITKRSLGLSQTDNINLPLTKEYDGTATLTAANASDVLTIDSSTGGTTGIIGDDKVTLGGTVDATFYDNSKDKNLSPNVGKNKYVEATFKSVTLTGTDAANYSVGGTGDIKVTSTAGMITPRNITVSLENSTGIDKTYDGTTDVSSDSAGKVTNNINDKRLGSDNLKLVDLTATDKTAEVSTYAGQYNDKNASDAAEDKTITYKGIALSGDETTLANYRIVDGKGNVLYYNPGSTSNGFDAVNTTDGGTLTGTGTITRRYIDQSVFNDPEITKVYDNTNTGTIDSAIELTQTRVSTDNAKTEKSGIIDGDDLSFNIAAGTTVYYLDKDGNQSDEAKNATGYNGDDSGAQKAQYSVSVTGNDLKNYTWDSSDTNIKEAVADSFDRTTDNAKITKRNIILSYTGTDKPSKVYDGDNIVKALDSSNQYTEQAFIDKATTYITYGQNTDKANQLLKDADSSNDDGTTYSVSGRYDDANVAYKAGTTNYTEDDVAEKTVSYNIVLKNNTATKLGNYTVNGKALTIDTTKNTAQSSDAALTDTGKITPAHITNVTFADATKEYDGTDVNTYASPTDGAMEVNGVTGIVSADTTKGITAADIIDVTGATGTYGTGEGTNFVASSHVKDVNDANGKVKYTGFKLKDTTAAHNYLLEPTEAYGKGKITQKTIGTSDVTVNFGEIKKVYDGTKALKKDAKDYIKSITINAIAGDTISKDDLTASAEYDTEDVNAKKANYTIKFSGTGSDVSDYKFEGGTLSTDADASITVRPVYVKVNDGYKTGVNKTYDGTQQLNGKYDLTKAISVVDNTGDDTGLITGANADGVTLDTSADTVGGKNGPYDSKNAGDRTLTYNVSLKDNGSGDDVKNYVVYNYDDINKADKTAITTLTGTGTILRRGVVLSIESDVNKVYDGANNTGLGIDESGKTWTNSDLLSIDKTVADVSTTNNGIIAADVDKVSLNADGFTTNYYRTGTDTKDGNADVNGSTHDVVSKLNQGATGLTGDAAQNYYLIDSEGNAVSSIKTTGKITPRTINKVVFADVSKTYDGNNDVTNTKTGGTYPTNDVITITGVTDDSGNSVIQGDDKIENIFRATDKITGEYGHSNTAGESSGFVGTPNATKNTDGGANTARYTNIGKALTNKNYQLASGADTQYGKGTINQRKINATLKDDSDLRKDLTKDGTMFERDYNTEKYSVTLEDLTLDDSAIVTDDKGKVALAKKAYSTITTNGVVAETSSADADDNAYELAYDVELSGDKAKNYAFSVVAPTKAKIDKRAIKVTIGENSKDYNGDASVGNENIKTAVGLVDDKNNVNDALKIEIGNLDKEYNSGNVITGTYGTYSTVTEQNGKKTATASDTFNENGDVSRSGITTASDVYTADADKKYGYKAVKYEGMDTALANAKYADDRSYSKNYEITEVVGANGDATKTMTTGNSSLVSTAYFNEAAEQGIIRPIAITNAATVNKTWTGDIVKTYDGTTDVKNPKDYLKLSYTVNGKDYAIDSYDVGKVYYNDKNVATANSVTYEGISFKPTVEDNPNLDFTDLNKDGTIPIGNETLNNGDTINGTKYRVAIEKRTVNLVLPDTSIDKTYDGTTDVSDADKAKFSYEATKNETGLIAGDDVAVNYSNIVYDGANAKYDLDGNQLSNGETNNVSYTATLAGADKDNYQLSNDNGNTVSDSITGSVAGKIFQRAVYVDFTDDAKKAFASTDADGYKGIVKKYDGETTVPDAYSGEKAVQLAGGNGRSANDADGKTTGIVDTGVTLDSVDEAYESSNVARDKNGNVQSQDVYYTAFKLKDSSGKNLDKNYVVKTSESNYRGTVNNADALVGTGTIAPIKVKVAVKDGISKVYDGKSDLVSRDMQGNTIKDYGTFDQIDYSSDDATLILNGGSLDAKLSDAKTIQGAIAIDKSYFINKDDNEDANVASAVGVDYYLKYNSNFELIKVGTNSSTKPTELSTQTLTARLRGDGSITPRTLKVDDIAGVSKVYDGTSDFNGAVDVKFNDAIADADSLGIKATGGTFYDSTGTDKVKDAGSNYVVKDMSIDATNLNSNYQLVDADGKNLTTASGLTTGATSEIERATVVVTPVNVSLPAGQKLDPSYEFTGNFSDLSNSVKGYNEDREKFGDFTYDLLDRVPAQNGTSGTYQIYSWQDKGKTNEVTKAGLELNGDEYKNYRFVLGDGFLTIAKPDDPHHPVNPVDPNRPVRPSDIIKDITNKDIPEHEIDRYEESVRDATRFVPDDRSYFRASYDEDEAHYGRKPVIDLIAHNGGVNLGDEATLDYDGSIGVESDAPTLVGGSVSVDGDRLSIASSNVTFADEDSALSTLSNGVTTNEAEAVAREAANAASEANMSESANAATPRVRMGRYMTSTVAESESTAASAVEALPTASVSETEPVATSAVSEAAEPSDAMSTTQIMSRESMGVYDAESGSYDTYLSAGEGEASEPETWTARYEREQAASTGITINSKDDDDDDESSLDDKALVASNIGNIGIETKGMGVNLSALG